MYNYNDTLTIIKNANLEFLIKKLLNIPENSFSLENEYGFNILLKNNDDKSFVIIFKYFNEQVYKLGIYNDDISFKYINRIIKNAIRDANSNVLDKQCLIITYNEEKFKVLINTTILGAINKLAKVIPNMDIKNIKIEPLSIYNMIDKEPI